MKQLMMFALDGPAVEIPEGTVMHPTYHELKQAMMVDEANRPETTAPVMVQPVADAAPVPRKRKPRRKDINVADSTPF